MTRAPSANDYWTNRLNHNKEKSKIDETIFKTARLSSSSANKQSANRPAIRSEMIQSKDEIEVGSYLKDPYRYC